MANRFQPLSEVERSVYDAVTEALSRLSDTSQHNVLREIAFRMGREVVRPGAVRTAAAAAAMRAAGSGRPSEAKPKRREHRAEDPDYARFLETEQAKGLVRQRDEVKRSMSDPPTDAQKTQLSELSRTLRNAYESFRAATCEQAPEEPSTSARHEAEAAQSVAEAFANEGALPPRDPKPKKGKGK